MESYSKLLLRNMAIQMLISTDNSQKFVFKYTLHESRLSLNRLCLDCLYNIFCRSFNHSPNSWGCLISIFNCPSKRAFFFHFTQTCSGQGSAIWLQHKLQSHRYFLGETGEFPTNLNTSNSANKQRFFCTKYARKTIGAT